MKAKEGDSNATDSHYQTLGGENTQYASPSINGIRLIHLHAGDLSRVWEARP
ncbi:hypothetical protein RISK_000103 [Rhodopirellula islandica]|uniref:Uncharacterized protein n=1 Tax=Rhodopirellula islandica TaxID=595434 RepID=A0A0J1ER24_RHOIS|nr:hypothetical protein RISK_000103 [Rhodopirellula islandica]